MKREDGLRHAVLLGQFLSCVKSRRKPWQRVMFKGPPEQSWETTKTQDLCLCQEKACGQWIPEFDARL